jgi:hypothetical protein
LRQHCDKLIRRAYPGMVLSKQSLFLIRSPHSEPISKRRMSLLNRLRRRLAPTHKSVGPSPPLAPQNPSSPDLKLEREGIRSQLEGIRSQLLTARAVSTMPSVPSPVEAPSETSPPKPSPKQVQETPEVTWSTPEAPLAPLTPPPIVEEDPVVGRLQSSGEVSPATLAQVQSFKQRAGRPRSSQETVRGIYSTIFADRHIEAWEAASQDASDSPKPSPSSDKLDSGPGEADLALREELEALFASSQSPSSTPLGLSMVSFPASGRQEGKVSP